MKRYDRHEGFIDGLPNLSRRWLRQLRTMIVLFLLTLQIPISRGYAATPAAETHVYLLRGVLNIFSLGLDEVAAKLRQQGINATVANYLSWSSLAGSKPRPNTESPVKNP